MRVKKELIKTGLKIEGDLPESLSHTWLETASENFIPDIVAFSRQQVVNPEVDSAIRQLRKSFSKRMPPGTSRSSSSGSKTSARDVLSRLPRLRDVVAVDPLKAPVLLLEQSVSSSLLTSRGSR